MVGICLQRVVGLGQPSMSRVDSGAARLLRGHSNPGKAIVLSCSVNVFDYTNAGTLLVSSICVVVLVASE